MDNKEIREKLKTKEYDFLRTDQRLGDRIAILTLGGSHAYGTNIETSDLDIRGCTLETRKQLITGNSFEQITNSPTDTTIYNLRKLVSLLAQCNPNVIEMLGCRKEDYFIVSEAGQMLLDNKFLFLSKAAYRSFGGYASAQLRRLDNKTARTFTHQDTQEHIVGRLREMNERKEIDFSVLDNEDYSIAVSGTLDHVPFKDLYAEFGTLNQTVREYEKNSERNRHAAEHGKISKHAMHLLRLYMMGIDILKDGEIITYREKEHDLLMSIRNGDYQDENEQMKPEFFEMVREYEERMEDAYLHSSLPSHPNQKKIDELIINIYESYVI